MKRVFSFLILFALIASYSHCFAEDKPFSPSLTKKTVGVVIVGPVDFRTPDFLEIAVTQLLKKFDPTLYNLSVGGEPQNRYQKYWDDKGFLTEQPATKSDLLAFSQASSYDYVLFLVINPPTTETQKRNRYKDQTRVSLEVMAMYVDSNQQNIISKLSSVQEDDSLYSPLRAKRGAFQKVLGYISLNLGLK